MQQQKKGKKIKAEGVNKYFAMKAAAAKNFGGRTTTLLDKKYVKRLDEQNGKERNRNHVELMWQ